MEDRNRNRRGVLEIGAPDSDAAPRAREARRSLILRPGEDREWLSRAQAELWELRRVCDWVCVRADRTGAGLAAALAAQLPVERLALAGSRLFDRSGARLQGQAARLERFARRNLALVVSEVVLIGASEREIRGFAAMLGRRRVCALDGGGEKILTAPWAEVNENNLLIPGKCV